MRKFYLFLSIGVLALLIYKFQFTEGTPTPVKKSSKEERIEGYFEDLKKTSSDVDLGYIPYEKLHKAIEIGKARVALQKSSRSFNGSLTEAVWRERGPNNIGGRTRAIMIDASDPSGNRVWVGAVGGGVWRTEDISQADAQWVKMGHQLENISIGAIAQDPNNHNIIYVGTGEGYPNLDAIAGIGIFKSTDGGAEWILLPSTQNANFRNTHEIFVHKNGDLYAATHDGGLFRSQDGGEMWLKVLGTSLSGATDDSFYDFQYVETGNVFYASNGNSIFKSFTGDRGDWTNIGTTKQGFPLDLNRVEMSVCANDASMVYVLGSVNGGASNTYVSTDGGETWVGRSSPGLMPGQDFTNGQAWYDLDIAVDPFNCNRVIAGGVPVFESTLQAVSWTPISGNLHVDQHNVTFDPQRQGRVLFGNDGGIWESINGGQTISNKNDGYVTTQFYAGAIHPNAGSHYILGGTQDNNTLQITEPGLSPANSVWGGDGVFCFIDQNEPDTQIVSSQNGNYGLSLDGGGEFGAGAAVNGSFINRSGYDDEANILYGQINSGGFFRWIIGGTTTEVKINGDPNFQVSAVKADPNNPNRIFFGGEDGRVYRINNAHTGTNVTGTRIADFNSGVSSVYMDKSNSNDIIVSLFNYGGNLENVHVTEDGGAEWISIEGDLPDMPVRWAMFDPANHKRAIIATEAGVWTTDNINGDSTRWMPSNPDNGMPFVRVDMLVMRDSDKTVLAATHGRGLITTEVFSAPAAVIITQPIAYEDQPILIDGSFSVNAQSYEWELNGNSISNAQTFTHTFDNPGTYTFELTINGDPDLKITRTISVLPYLPAPYQESEPGYTGDFESSPEHFAAYTVSGTGFSRGSSTKPGKEGTHSGTNAWILGRDVNLYANNTRAELYTPQYDLSQSGLFELKFWTKFAIQNRNDGFQIEYSLNSGATWQQLGSADDPAWYNYLNSNLDDGAWPKGKAYFTNNQVGWTHYVKDISFLAGEERVSFRFVFRSDATGQAQGFVIDDFEVTKYQGPLQTTITVFAAQYDEEQDITLTWTTGIEFQAKQFALERSFTGFGFEHVATLNATGVVSTVPQEYTRVDQSLRDLIYYRIKVTNDNPDIGYHYEFFSDTIVVRRDVDPDLVHKVLTNPFTDKIMISFSSMVNQAVTIRMFDISGKLVMERVDTPNSVAYALNNLRFTPGIYILSIQVGENEPSTHKMFTY